MITNYRVAITLAVDNTTHSTHRYCNVSRGTSKALHTDDE